MAANSRNLDPRTSAQAAFAAELRKYRKLRNLTQEQVARALACDQSLISALENCKRTPQRDQAERLDQFFGLTEERVFVQIYERMVREMRSPRWSVRWADEIEPRASVLRTWSPMVVYGLLQVDAYARALLTASPTAPRDPEWIEEQIRIRMQRKVLLDRDPPPAIWDLIDEEVLHRPIGGIAVLVEQLRFLLEISAHSAVTIQIVPAATDCAVALMGSFALAEVLDHGDAVLVESTAGGHVITDSLVVAQHHKYHDTVRAHAYPKKQSQQMIRDAIEKWSKQI
ncbi:Scr1 family TA system antitoxin-like transcriptional regulator [Spongiactinospora sp. 9N601]|uniref:helix-turn-helix domain-containing protein n=1 Tax=Spongiactinospora sp. 9N601 TaxID=3375149 RepID=UPI0037880C92